MISNKLAISTSSLSQDPSHSLHHKVHAAADAGYEGVEIVYGELEAWSQLQNISLLAAAEKIKSICDGRNLTILSLAPFENYEGDRSPLHERLQKANLWIEVARKLQAPFLQVPAHYGLNASGDENVIVTELQQLADLASSKRPRVSIAYEPMSWSTHHSTWESALALTTAVDRLNFGLCLDTFHIATNLWGDCLAPSGKFPHADENLQASLRRYLDSCPLDKVFFVQLSDGEKFEPPFSVAHPWYQAGEAPQFTWSKHARPFPYESHFGAYLPVAEIAKACIVDKKYTGWVSLEIFDRRMRQGDVQPETAALRGMESWKRLNADICRAEPKL
ncbi:AP endonuclease family 2 [Penicillium capsulatum]|uniref:AP endonuclease family 2 n=1 Tax=Penicillium capsulatum TaxID=69766 RepID=A0A9W9LZI4_9EURO|nr:AP endonuclease family 2 [Penicillium capsulatum]KAJ6129718.1 AP endonuclease family 2 [Penicillium capsulatum]